MLKILLSVTLLCSTYLADNGYDREFLDLVEIVYGDGYLSQGGSAMVDCMLEGVNLEGKEVLDLGCGIGGPAVHIAKTYGANVTAADPDKMILARAKEIFPNEEVDFVHMSAPHSLKQFSDKSFDVVFSKEAFVHLPNTKKQAFFSEILRVLKPGGTLVILDWLHSSPNYSPEVKNMMEMDGVPFHLVTPDEYQQLVAHAGFNEVYYLDQTAHHAKETEENLLTIKEAKQKIISKFDSETYSYSLKSWEIQKHAFERQELLVGIIKGKKPTS